MLTRTQMEDTLNKLDRRLKGVEQILPTLATKSDLEGFATKTDLERFATKADLERFATKADLERFATKADLERFATKDELRDGIGEAKRHTDVRIEDVRDDIRKVAEGVAALAAGFETNQKTLEVVVQQLDAHETLLRELTKKRRK